ncbi:MAG TPA: tRNA-specific adenosine deaminase [Bacteroidetes bacterium]|nr:nucleoside deaminase [Ignavibacteria bacterium]HCA42832.1 tRNA-specific adenosine deaminase [Bacteroidota bacterium]HCN36933.1 tRNA-specific adenosine deaminase [Bacteroidota bacterium]
MSEHERFMKYALKEAEKGFDAGEMPVGCIITFNNTIIAKSHNNVETLRDATAHAEILAITSASEYLNSKYLPGCTMYVTLEPCPMCAGALVNSKIDNLYFGAYDSKSGACGSVFQITNSKNLNHKVNVYGGILDTESISLINSFFLDKRN